MDVTDRIQKFRECARHLWNTAFFPEADWDDRERFGRVCTALFDAMVLGPLGLEDAVLPDIEFHDKAPMRCLRVVPSISSGTPIMINRTPRPGGYWDDPVDRVDADAVWLELVHFFDWAPLERRDFEFFLVAIREFPSQPHLVERRALVRCEDATVHVCRER